MSQIGCNTRPNDHPQEKEDSVYRRVCDLHKKQVKMGILNQRKHNRPLPAFVTVVATHDEDLQAAVVARRSFGVEKVLARMGRGG